MDAELVWWLKGLDLDRLATVLALLVALLLAVDNYFLRQKLGAIAPSPAEEIIDE